jgi:DNA-binding response OmpR family regulator
MPEMDGYMLCKQVKADPRWANIPIIFYSATFTSRQDEIFAVKLGATRFIRKPAEPEFLIKSIKDVLESQAKGYLEPAKYKFKDEKEVYKVYNERLIKKLEKKVTELEEIKKILNLSQDRLSKAAKIDKLGYWEYLVKEDIFIFDDYFYAIFHTTAEEVGGYQMKPNNMQSAFYTPMTGILFK